MRTKKVVALSLVAACALVQPACRSAVEDGRPAAPPWDVDRAEVVGWTASDPFFEQGYALEASGLAASQGVLLIPSEKYGRLLLVGDGRAEVIRLDTPRHAELEGVTIGTAGALLCDEAHAAVYELPLDGEVRQLAETPQPIPVKRLALEGVGVTGGKIGFEGIEVHRDDGTVYLLLERSGDEGSGCVSRIWALDRAGSGLHSRGAPIEVALEDCAWRLTGLAWWREELIALKTQFPGERYEVVTIDLESGDANVILELTDLLRSLAGEGWSNNVEGIAIGPDGSLWMVADNAVTGVIDDPLPPKIESRTLLLRVPPSKTAAH